MRSPQDVDVLNIDKPIVNETTRPLRAVPITVFVVLVLFDQATKMWAEARLDPGACVAGGNGCVDLIGSLRFNLVYNPGAAFSTGAGLGPLFGILAIIMSVVLGTLALRSTDRVVAVLMAMIAAGAIGNVTDRVLRADDGPLSGKVIDFIDLQWWPVFNVADSAVVVGVVLFIVRSLFVADPSLGVMGADSTSRSEPALDTTSNEAVGAPASGGAVAPKNAALDDA